jgi:hypothetical protein
VGAVGATAAVGVTGFVRGEGAPDPLALTAWTVNVYVVPLVRPVTVVRVAEPDAVVAACGSSPTYGVILYEPTGPPPAGAVQLTAADDVPATLALAVVTAPGRGIA